MDLLTSTFSVVSILSAALLITNATRPIGFVEWVLFLMPILSGFILCSGYFLSAFNLFGSITAWAGISGVLFFIAVCIHISLKNGNIIREFSGFSGLSLSVRRLKSDYISLSLFEKLILTPCIIVVFILGAINLWIVVGTAPHNWDSMTCHLARIAYYLQHGNLDYYDANYWAQATHPKIAAILFSFAYLVSDRNENFTQLVQYISYWVALISVYGISRCIGGSRFSSLFSGLVFGLLIECLMQATTTQSDMLVTAYIGCAVYGLFAWRKYQLRKYLVLASLAIAIALGIKGSVLLVIPSIALLVVYLVIDKYRHLADGESNPGLTEIKGGCNRRKLVGDVSVFLLSGALSVAVFLVPSGYVDNWKRFNNPIGPEFVSKAHSFQGKTADYIFIHGTRNMFRYGFDFLSLDGLPSGGIIGKTQRVFKDSVYKIFSGLDLDSAEETRRPFKHDRPPAKHEDLSYWGIWGFGLLLPLVLLSLFGVIPSLQCRMISLAALLFLMAQSYSSLYDPWRGRYFITAAIFAAPVLGFWMRGTHSDFIKLYLIGIVLLGCLSSTVAVIYRQNSMPGKIFNMDRLSQLTRNRKVYTEPIRTFDQLVPKDATVAVIFGPDTYEYPLFGEGLTRRLIPVNGFNNGLRPVPPEAEYLLYSDEIVKDHQKSDVHLGKDWYLRTIKHD